MASSVIDAIIDALRRNPAGSAELARACGCDRSTVTRQLKLLESQLVATGRARSTLYDLRHSANIETPLVRGSETGKAEHFGTLIAVMPQGYLVKTPQDADYGKKQFESV